MSKTKNSKKTIDYSKVLIIGNSNIPFIPKDCVRFYGVDNKHEHIIGLQFQVISTYFQLRLQSENLLSKLTEHLEWQYAVVFDNEKNLLIFYLRKIPKNQNQDDILKDFQNLLI